MDIRGKRSIRSSLLALAAAAVGVLGSVQTASAQQSFKFNPLGDGLAGDTYTVTGLNFANGNALAVGALAGGPLTVGETFQVYYQTHLSTLNGITTQPAGLNTSYQITEVATLSETVTSITNSGGVVTANFSLNPGAATNQIAIYYNNAVTYNDAMGTGFTSGIKIASLNPTGFVVSNFSDNTNLGLAPFNQFGSGYGTAANSIQGGGNTTISNSINFANASFFNPTGGFPLNTSSVFGSGLQAPFTALPASLMFTNPISGTSFQPNIGGLYPTAAGAVNGVTGPDLQLQVVGFTQGFASAVVPEPASVTLMGLGVVGALVLVRRTRARVA